MLFAQLASSLNSSQGDIGRFEQLVATGQELEAVIPRPVRTGWQLDPSNS